MQQSGSEDSGDNHPDLSGLALLPKQALPPPSLLVSPDSTWDSFPSLFLLISDERSTTGLPVRSIIGTALGVLLGIALTASLGCLLLCTKTGR